MIAGKSILLVAALLFGALSIFVPQDLGSTGPNSKISVDEFHSGNVIGHLGQPLGSVIRVSGMAVDGDESGRKADSSQTLLKIESVNGKRLASPVYFTFHRAADGIERPKSGSSFDYFVHEWGSFDGIVQPPKELGIETPAVAHDGFHYRPEITIHKSNPIPRGSTQQSK